MRSIIKHLPIVLIVSVAILSGFITKQDKQDVPDYYGIPTLSFNNLNYKLAWSAHPNDKYYKHEYVPSGEKVDHFNNMIVIDFIETEMHVKDAVAAQVNNITERKKTDAVCNYQILKKSNDDFILDFIMSENTNRTVTIIEWNAYHYIQYTDKNGHKGILLFGISHRAYDDLATPFLKTLGTFRNNNLKALGTYNMPEIQIK
jgi:hypothetical protein